MGGRWGKGGNVGGGGQEGKVVGAGGGGSYLTFVGTALPGKGQRTVRKQGPSGRALYTRPALQAQGQVSPEVLGRLGRLGGSLTTCSTLFF